MFGRLYVEMMGSVTFIFLSTYAIDMRPFIYNLKNVNVEEEAEIYKEEILV